MAASQAVCTSESKPRKCFLQMSADWSKTLAQNVAASGLRGMAKANKKSFDAAKQDAAGDVLAMFVHLQSLQPATCQFHL